MVQFSKVIECFGFVTFEAFKATLREPGEGRFVCTGLLLLPWLCCACILEDVVSMAYWHRPHIHHSFPFGFILWLIKQFSGIEQ